MRLDRRLLVAPLAVGAVVVAALSVGDHGGDPAAEGAGDAAETGSPGSAGSAGRIVTSEEFCDAFGRLAVAQQAVFSDATPATVGALKDTAATVGELAAGTDMDDRARAGVAFVVTAFTGLTDDATAQDIVESDDAATLQDDSHAQALAAYIGDSCGRSGLSEAQ